MVESWDGSLWHSEPLPPSRDPSKLTLSGVSCATSAHCEVVGLDGATLRPFAAVWNGSGWVVQHVSSPSGDGINYSGFVSVTCTAANACTGVGFSDDTSTGAPEISTIPFAERWNGSTWQIQPVTGPTAEIVDLTSVSCATRVDCVATGYSATTRFRPAAGFAEHWDGSTWSPTPPADPPTKNFYLDSVACTSTTSCLTVGDVPQPAKGSLVEQWDGSSWTRQSIHDLAGASLFGITCRLHGECLVAGSGDRTFVARWDGATWTRQAVSHVPTMPSGGQFDAASCASPSPCAIVGGTNQSHAMADWWDGSHWTTRAPPVPAGVRFSPLTAVSCPQSTGCVAVGWTDHGLLADRRDAAGGWTLLVPVQPALSNPVFTGVACTSATACVAVGSGRLPNGSERTLSERWNGSSWSLLSTPNASGVTNSSLSAISCASASDCTAVGEAHSTSNTGQTLIFHWNGSSWSIVPAPQPPGAQDAVLNGVSCTSGSACVAVGLQFDGTQESLLIERYNGTGWSTQQADDPDAGTETGLKAVSCASADSCVALGDVIERWNGSAWSAETAPYPDGGVGEALLGVSCPSGGPCLAVSGTSDGYPVVERSRTTT